MPNLFVVINHELLQNQREDAVKTLHIDTFVFPPDHIQHIWQQIPPHNDIVIDVVKPIIEWLANNSVPDDYILVQGDFGATFLLVSWALHNHRIPIYSTTQRKYESRVNEKGEIVNVHVFKHVKFRRYVMIHSL